MKLRRAHLYALAFSVSLFCPAASKVFQPTDSILLNCGSSFNASDADGRKWEADDGRYLVSAGNSSLANAESQDPSLPSPVPYMTARVFTAESTYNFSVAAGDRHWVRLHFYPSAYNGEPCEDSFFTVSASGGVNGFTLLDNFSVFITAKALTQAYIVKEFSLPPAPSGAVTLTFRPSDNTTNSIAFVNGIEIISMPEIFGEPATMVGFSDSVTALSMTAGEQTMSYNGGALQTVARLNVGGQYIPPTNDSSGMSRTWYDDSFYVQGAGIGVTDRAGDKFKVLYPDAAAESAAPAEVYSSARTMGPNANVNKNYNLSWLLPVDGNFTYVVRLHFCEFQLTKVNQRVFDIYINNKTAQSAVDVLALAPGKGVPAHKDYALFVADTPAGSGDDVQLRVALHPSVPAKPEFYDAILNGLEVFKMSDGYGNLAGPNPEPSEMLAKNELMYTSAGFAPKSSTHVIRTAAGGAAAMGVLAAICIAVHMQQKKKMAGGEYSSSWLPIYGGGGGGHSHTSGSTTSRSTNLAVNLAGICRHFSFSEIKAATKHFDESLVIGVGGFGKVYRGVVDGSTKVAIKRSNPSSEQGVLEFQTEIEMLSKLRHKHLVSLIGFCEENGEMVLVYDYMAHGTLREHLYNKGSKLPQLPWRQRLEISIGAARGLHYLHTGSKYPIIHRDVKTTNILVDENWVAKVSDFGLSKTGPTAMNQTHVSTMVKGSFGYLDPEYFRRQQLTEKSDVYSFGVVLFEVLCARPALNAKLPREQVSLADWALSCQRRGTLENIVDPFLKNKIAPECLKKFAETAEKCLADHGVDRPSMGDVLWNLEFALQLQDSFEQGKTEGSVRAQRQGGGGNDDELGDTDTAVFSQLVNQAGR